MRSSDVLRTAKVVGVLTLGLVIGCREKPTTDPDPVAQPGSGSASGAGSASGSGAGSAAVAPRAPGPFLPTQIPAKHGIAFAEAAGGTSEAKAPDGTAVPVKDGTVLTVDREGEAVIGNSKASMDAITVAGNKLSISARNVIVESRLKRSPDGSTALFYLIDSCGDVCHTELSVVTSDGRRVALGDGTVDVVAAWRKDGKELVVGSGGLWIVSLPDLAVQTLDEYTAPAYGPDGTLYVRDQDGSGFTLVGAEAKRVFKAKKPPPLQEGDYGADDPTPPTFNAAGKPTFN